MAGVLAALLSMSVAAPPAHANPVTDSKRVRGPLVSGGVGLNGCTGNRCDNVHPLFFTKLHTLFRLLRYLAPGLHLSFLFQAPDFPTEDARAELWDLLFGPEVRGILPIHSFDLWTGLAFGYYRSFRLVASDGHRIKSVVHAFGLAWGFGVDYFIIKDRLALGGDFWLYKAVPTEICTQVGGNAQACTDSDPGRGFGLTIAVGFTVVWFVSL